MKKSNQKIISGEGTQLNVNNKSSKKLSDLLIDIDSDDC